MQKVKVVTVVRFENRHLIGQEAWILEKDIESGDGYNCDYLLFEDGSEYLVRKEHYVKI